MAVVPRPILGRLPSYVAVAAAVLFTLAQLSPSLLVLDTTPAGGDMGAHVWLPAYLRDHLLPQGRITGWTPDWYLGFPALTFYFPLPSLLIVFLDAFLPYGIAFKLVSVSGVVTLPIAAYVMGRLFRAPEPLPAALAVGSVGFLFERGFTIYGGNIPSTLAGEFAFSISLSLALVYLGVLARSLETGRYRAWAAALLGLTALAHVVPTFFAIGATAVLLLMRADRARIRLVATVSAVGGLLAAFWVVPFLARIAYTNDMGWEKLTTYRTLLVPPNLEWLVVMAGLGGGLSIVLRRRLGVFLTAMAAVSAIAFWLAPQGRLWNARLIPFWFLCLYLLAALLVCEALRGLVLLVGGRETAEQRGLTSVAAVPTAIAALYLVAIPLHVLPASLPFASTADRSFIQDWVKWNYSGYERKPSYPEYRGVVTTMEQVGADRGCGRAMWEYEPELDRLGTPMALMLLPHWTDGCIGSMEGLFFESSATTPYHFLNQSELSRAPSRAQRGLPYRDLDVRAGVAHLQLLGVKYYMVISPEAQAQARSNPDLDLVTTSGPWSVNYPDGTKQRTWEIYEVAGSSVVAPLEYEPVVVTDVPKGGRGWLDAAVDWYQDESRWDVHLAAAGPSGWARVDGPGEAPPRKRLDQVSVSDIRTGDDSISFDVSRPGVPVVVKASYFPNWQAEGAEGPYRVAPNLMVVVPTAKHVELRYGQTPVDGLAWLLTGLGLVSLVGLARRRVAVLPEPPPPPPEPEDEDAPWPFDPRPPALVSVGAPDDEVPPADGRDGLDAVHAPRSFVDRFGLPPEGGAPSSAPSEPWDAAPPVPQDDVAPPHEVAPRHDVAPIQDVTPMHDVAPVHAAPTDGPRDAAAPVGDPAPGHDVARDDRQPR